MKSFVLAVVSHIEHWLDKPGRVLTACLVFLSLQVVFDGTLWSYVKLTKQHQDFGQRIAVLRLESQRLGVALQESRQIPFVEKLARDRFDLVSQGDLVFVFAEDQ